ncbi:hypothetical protein WS70_11165 [Burkholderia mayonis]|uniref:Uncharacterized protein n=1 Tax=Burkholderia mayonis TaxID=1385591 RepID=A0A1B4FFB1_9BURK|nr:hypothetical protein WS70_11165 [Burkholderia mayonis]KVE36130.1 hypothetical protein WS69_12940 [Burkholderia sp. BDU5]KVE47064.1 hypothetical protein WS70_27960 [Burkholderia mayonis]
MKVVGRDIWIGIWAFVRARDRRDDALGTRRRHRRAAARKRDLGALSEVRDRLRRRIGVRNGALRATPASLRRRSRRRSR